MVGESDAWVREHGGRRELCDIADDEQLILEFLFKFDWMRT
jgi:hypothetical protein